jgi:co-chaperonin GroES (HSP10)
MLGGIPGMVDEAMKIMPTADRLLIRKCYRPDADDGVGVIVIPDWSKSQTNFGVVLAVGPECKHFGVDDELNWDQLEEVVMVQAPGGEIGFSQDINHAPGENEYFVRERSLSPPAKFLVRKPLTP